MNSSDRPLQLFTLYPFPYSSNIESAYQKVKIHPSQCRYQLLVLFDFKQKDWWAHPIVVEQCGMPFGSTQAGVYLELVLEEVAEQTLIKIVQIIIKYNRQVYNIMFSLKTKEMLEHIGNEINTIMNRNNLQLQILYSTNKANHYDFSLEAPSEVVVGYIWNKVNDTILPNTIISHGRSGQGLKGKLLREHPFSPVSITK